MKRMIKSIVFNAAYCTAIYFAIFEGSIGAERVVIAATIFLFIGSPFCLMPAVKKEFEGKGRPLPRPLNLIIDLVIIGVFVWCGWWVMATLFILHCAFISMAYFKAVEAEPC